MTRWLPFALATATLVVALWIFVPGPIYSLLVFAVGAPEISAWLIVASLVSIVLASPSAQTSWLARIAVAAGVLALLLSATPWMRLRTVMDDFDAATRDVSLEPPDPQRTSHVSVADLFRGIRVPPAPVSTVMMRYDAGSSNNAPLTTQIYLPAQKGSRPVVIQIYGGAWRGGAPTDFANCAAWLAAAGYVVFAIDYRHAPSFTWRDQLADVDSALVWVRDNAAHYGGDPSRIVLLGRSAGAHLAMLSAFSNPPIVVRGLVSLYGPSDLVDSYRHPPRPDPLHVRRVEEAFIGGSLERKRDEYEAASPISHVNRRLPPTLIIQGARDHIVEARYSRALHDRLAANGTPTAYLEIPWAEHAFDEVFNGPSSQLSLYYVERFLAWATH